MRSLGVVLVLALGGLFATAAPGTASESVDNSELASIRGGVLKECEASGTCTNVITGTDLCGQIMGQGGPQSFQNCGPIASVTCFAGTCKNDKTARFCGRVTQSSCHLVFNPDTDCGTIHDGTCPVVCSPIAPPQPCPGGQMMSCQTGTTCTEGTNDFQCFLQKCNG
jgi:hypothetical protein